VKLTLLFPRILILAYFRQPPTSPICVSEFPLKLGFNSTLFFGIERMIELITPFDWVNSPKIREEVFRFRHNVFIRRLAWEIKSHEGLEFDEYDALLPVYMIARDSTHNLIALWRLLPTTGPYMLKNTFPDLFGERKAPKSKHVWEISRFAFDPLKIGPEQVSEFTQIAGKMFCALGEFGLENDIREVIAVYDYRITPILKSLSCVPIWSGIPKKIGNSMAIAASFEVSQEKLSILKEVMAQFEPILTKFSPKQEAA